MKSLFPAGACALLLAACGGGADVRPAPPVTFQNTVLPSITVVAPAAEVLDRTQFSRIAAPRTAVAANAEQWGKLWSEHGGAGALPAVDFAKRMVLGVFLGERNDGCANAHIQSVEKTAQKLVVTYAERNPLAEGLADACIAAIVTPAELVSVERTDLPVEFVKAERAAAIPALTIARDVRSNVRLAKTAVVTTQADWTALWRQHSEAKEPAVDFTKQTVLAVFAGTGGGCDELDIERVYRAGARTIVEYKFGKLTTLPIACTKDIKYLAHFVAVPRVESATYSFLRLPVPQPGDALDDPAGLQPVVLEQTDGSLLFQGALAQIDDQATWADFWRRHHGAGADAPALPKVDFATRTVLAVVEGTTLGGPGCGTLVLADVRFEGEKLVVGYGTRANPTFAACAPGPVNRAVIATIPKTRAVAEFRALGLLR